MVRILHHPPFQNSSCFFRLKYQKKRLKLGFAGNHYIFFFIREILYDNVYEKIYIPYEDAFSAVTWNYTNF